MNINGVNYDSYLAELAQVQTISTQQTTTTDESGNTTVTRTQIGSADINNQ
jgi:hypothetical protein